MKRLFLAIALSGAAFAACAQAPEADPTTPTKNTIRIVETVAVRGEAPAAEDDQRPIVNVVKQVEIDCVQQTGSRIRTKNRAGACNGMPGTAYSRKDLESRQVRTLLW